MSVEAGLHKLQEEVIAKAKAKGDADAEKKFYLTLFEPSHPDVVRQHLDSGALAVLIEQKKAAMLAKPSKWSFFRDPCYAYVLLGACAIGLGCTLPVEYITTLKKVYTEGGLMPGALRQMKKVLFGPDGFTNGVPYNFESKSLLETTNAIKDEDHKPNAFGFIGMNVIGPGGIFNTGMGDSSTSPVIKELRAQHAKPHACGGCAATAQPDGSALLQCAKCKVRVYCSTVCQKKHWKVHKKVCDPALY